LRAGKHQIPEKIFPQENDGARLQHGNDRFRVSTHEQGNFAEGLAGGEGANHEQLSALVALLHAKLTREQNPEPAMGAGDVEKVGARFGVDQLNRAQAPKIIRRDPGKYRDISKLLGEAHCLDLLDFRA
jgi:hypothetical protein